VQTKNVVRGVLIAASLLLGVDRLSASEDVIAHCVRTILLSDLCHDTHSTIQDAVNHADRGETVLVAAGTYYEHVVIAKDSVRLLGTLSAEGEPLSILHGAVRATYQIAINNARSVEIANFVIRRLNSDSTPIGFYNTDSNKIHNVTIYIGNCGWLGPDECGLSPSGLASIDEFDNEFYSTVLWDKSRAKFITEDESTELPTSRLRHVRRETSF
jgi:hypothetical protein